MIKLGEEELKTIATFENLTGAIVKDCIIEENRIIIVVKKGDAGLAIGRGGINVKRASQILGKKIEIVEHSEDPVEFIRNIFMPYRVLNVRIIEKGGKRIARVEVDIKDKSLCRTEKNLKKAKILAKRHFDIDDVIVV